MRSTSNVRVRYAETDQMGVAYHAHYLVWCELGRTDFIRELGLSYARLECDGLFLVVAEANVRYRAPARYDDVVRIETRLDSVRSRVLTFAYEIARPEPESPEPPVRLATATTTLVATDSAGTPRVLPRDLLRRFRDAASSMEE